MLADSKLISGIFTLALGSALAGHALAHDAKPQAAPSLSAQQALGERLFFDAALSEPPGQACASCHQPSAGFADPDRELAVSRGVHPERFANRNTPSAAYAAYTPALHYDAEDEVYVGGLFLDGRAASLEEQAKGPLLNPLEMANPDAASVIAKVRRAPYAALFEQVYGRGALDDAQQAFEYLAQAIAAFERSAAFNAFSSKYDAYLAGKAQLSAQELRGLKLFEDEKKGNCAACHPSRPAEDGSPALFTDFTYDNLGVPRNPDLPYYRLDARFNPAGAGYVDRGLGAALKDPAQDGKFKVPTLRNIALTGPYMHNGVFETLEEVVDFYNTRDVDRKWPAPEVAENVNEDELGDLKLTEQEVQDIAAFMRTLSDGYAPPLAAAQ